MSDWETAAIPDDEEDWLRVLASKGDGDTEDTWWEISDSFPMVPYSCEFANQRQKYGDNMLRKSEESFATQKQCGGEVQAKLDTAQQKRQEEKERQGALERSCGRGRSSGDGAESKKRCRGKLKRAGDQEDGEEQAAVFSEEDNMEKPKSCSASDEEESFVTSLRRSLGCAKSSFWHFRTTITFSLAESLLRSGPVLAAYFVSEVWAESDGEGGAVTT
ncbi:hypothetical protein B0H10DRAFT_1942648 [Mycena sp. CBHHK59/15]|nr:hypothetical protein B0H10DRAFT_1942648 [Mycena sp. CBHHK59/15]